MQDLNKLKKTIGRNVNRIRTEQNLTLSALAEKSGIRKEYLTKIENGQAPNINLNHIDRLCNTLKILIADLLL